MDTLRSMGRGLQLQTRGMGNESQFEDKSQLTSYLTSATESTTNAKITNVYVRENAFIFSA